MRALTVAVLLALAVAVFAADATVHPLTQETINANHMLSTLHYGHQALKNPYAKDFYHRYYTRPQKGQELLIQSLSQRVSDLQNDMKSQYPYRGFSPLDPNVYNYIINKGPNDLQNAELSNAIQEMNRIQGIKPAPAAPKMSESMIAELHNTMKGMRKTLHKAKLDQHNDHVYTGAFETPKMRQIMRAVNNMEDNVRRPLEPTPPNPEELAALNSLSQKMGVVGKRLHDRSYEALAEHAKSQSLMLERLVSMMRRMSNAIRSDRREAFLNAVHLLIHKYHLHDHPFVVSFENEISHAIATGKPLPLPEDLIQAEFDKQTKAATSTPATPTPTGTTNALDTKTPLGVAQEMKEYGRKLTQRGKELDHRADMAQRRTIPFEMHDELQQHLRQRLNSPATEVHVMGATRPTEY